jgi:hypothetical protein
LRSDREQAERDAAAAERSRSAAASALADAQTRLDALRPE